MLLHLNKTKFLVWIVVLLINLCFQGCSPNTAEIEKKILEYDPSFQKILDKRNELHKRLDQERAKFLKKKEDIDSQVNVLREQKRQIKQEYLLQASELNLQIQPDQRFLKKSIMELENNYRQKKEALGITEHDIGEISSLMKKKDTLALTPEEMKVWNNRMSLLVEKKEEQISEKNKVKKEIEITKLKLKVFN
ncbi:MAG: hypothetical protein ABIH85_03815 [Candidatus Omnitrophota bacterium]